MLENLRERSEPGGEVPQASESTASEAALVKARIDGWLSDELAQQRVENGLVDRYFGELKHALEKGSQNPPRFGPHPLRRMIGAWARAARDYGQTGNPYATGEGGSDDSRSVIARAKGETLGAPLEGFSMALDRGQRLRQQLAESSVNAIVAVVEIRQGPHGKLKAATLLESSGYRPFDHYVLKTAPATIEKFPEPPDTGAGIHPDGLRSTWAFVGKVVYKKKLREIDWAKNWWYLGLAVPLALAGGNFEETTGDVYLNDLLDPKFVCDVRLLGVY